MRTKACACCKGLFETPVGTKPAYCKPCRRAKAKACREADPASHRANRQKYADAQREYFARRRADSPEIIADAQRDHARKHPDSARLRYAKWRAKNSEKHNEKESRRRARHRLARPAWYDAEAARQVYALAKALTTKTGVAHHVDHIVPLRGKTVSGLHWHGNLQILRAEDNVRKSNRFDPNTPLAVGVL